VSNTKISGPTSVVEASHIQASTAASRSKESLGADRGLFHEALRRYLPRPDDQPVECHECALDMSGSTRRHVLQASDQVQS
jgi:hypothetical protein